MRRSSTVLAFRKVVSPPISITSCIFGGGPERQMKKKKQRGLVKRPTWGRGKHDETKKESYLGSYFFRSGIKNFIDGRRKTKEGYRK